MADKHEYDTPEAAQAAMNRGEIQNFVVVDGVVEVKTWDEGWGPPKEKYTK